MMRILPINYFPNRSSTQNNSLKTTPTSNVVSKSDICFKGAQPKEIEEFISKFSDVLGDVASSKLTQLFDGVYRSPVLSTATVANISDSYRKLQEGSLFKIIKDAEPSATGVKKFISDLLTHRDEFPFDVRSCNNQILISRPSSVMAGAESIEDRDAKLLTKMNPKVAEYICEKGLGGNLFRHKNTDYYVSPYYARACPYIFTGIKCEQLKVIK